MPRRSVVVRDTWRVPPHDLDAETKLLAGLLRGSSTAALALSKVAPKDFYRENNGLIYQAVMTLIRLDQQVDVLRVASELERQGVLERVGGHAHLAQLANVVWSVDELMLSAASIRVQADKRRLLDDYMAAFITAVAAPSSRSQYTGPMRLLNGLALLLPLGERSHFVAEAQGNLGDCDRWWQRVDHLVGLALGMPRLAWIMRRDGRRV